MTALTRVGRTAASPSRLARSAPPLRGFGLDRLSPARRGLAERTLTRPTYVGRHEFNKRAKNKTLKPVGEIVTVEVPPLIDQATFDAAL